MNIFYRDSSCWLGWSDVDGIISIHAEINQWSISAYKHYLSVFNSFLNQFPSGTLIYSVAKTEKAKKFNKLLGLHEFGKQEGGFIMRIEV